ncbi:YopX family protein [Tenacibaculum maritimum]|nr:YopX family protein [Tenacibaculum maritimum]MDB0613824.1 YopX family protein [Tenacibaculum maritimum]
MDREIKFRGFTERGNRVIGNLHIVEKGERTFINDFGNLYNVEDKTDGYRYKALYNSFEVIPESVGQYTGLKHEKTGVEIYEGDIFRSEEETDQGDIRTYSVVMWIEQRAAFYLIPCDHYQVIRDNDVSEEEQFEWLFRDAALYDFSIDVGLDLVGNIFENPELLANDIDVEFEQIKE